MRAEGAKVTTIAYTPRKPQCRIPNAFPLKLLLFHHLIQANTNTGRKKAYRFVPLCRYTLFCLVCLFHFGSLASTVEPRYNEVSRYRKKCSL